MMVNEFDTNVWIDAHMPLEDRSRHSCTNSLEYSPEGVATHSQPTSDTESDSDARPIREGNCEDCRDEKGSWYCGACTQLYCERCWKRRPAHKRKHQDSGNHMKSDYASQYVFS